MLSGTLLDNERGKERSDDHARGKNHREKGSGRRILKRWQHKTQKKSFHSLTLLKISKEHPKSDQDGIVREITLIYLINKITNHQKYCLWNNEG